MCSSVMMRGRDEREERETAMGVEKAAACRRKIAAPEAAEAAEAAANT